MSKNTRGGKRKGKGKGKSEPSGQEPGAKASGSDSHQSPGAESVQRGDSDLIRTSPPHTNWSSSASEEDRKVAEQQQAAATNMAGQDYDIQAELQLQADIAWTRTELAATQRKIEQAEDKLETVLDDRAYDRWQNKLARLADDKQALNAQLVQLQTNRTERAKRPQIADTMNQRLEDVERAVKRHRGSTYISSTFQREAASAARKAERAVPFQNQTRFIVLNLTDQPHQLGLPDGNVIVTQPLDEGSLLRYAEAINALPTDTRVFVIGRDVFESETNAVQPLATLVLSHLLETLLQEDLRYKCADTHGGGKSYLWENKSPDGVAFTLHCAIDGPATRQHLNSSNVAFVFEWKGSKTLDDDASLPQLVKYLFSFLRKSPQRRYVYGVLSDLHHGILVKASRDEQTGELAYEIFQRVFGPDLVSLIVGLFKATPEELDAAPLKMHLGTDTDAFELICLGATLGHGASGDVFTAIRVAENEPFALKGLTGSDTGRAHIEREFKILQVLQQDTSLLGKWVNVEASQRFVNRTPVLAMKLFRRSSPSLWQRAHIPGVVEAMQAICEAGYIHRDVRPSNFAFTAGDNPKPLIIDFGCAIQVTEPPQRYSGSRAYASFRFLKDDDGSLDDQSLFKFHPNDDLASLVLSIFSIFMTPDGCIENLPLFYTAGHSYRDFWRTRLPLVWYDLVIRLTQQVGAHHEPEHDAVRNFLVDNLWELPFFAHDADPGRNLDKVDDLLMFEQRK